MKHKMKHKIYQLKHKKKISAKHESDINDLLSFLSDKEIKLVKGRIEKLKKSPSLEIYLLEIGGEIAGIGSLHYLESWTKKGAHIDDIVVHPKHQGKGLGTKITKHLIGRAKKQKLHFLELTSRPSRVAANKLYQKLKFEPRETNVYRLKLGNKDKK